jgi:hypothetical protein
LLQLSQDSFDLHRDALEGKAFHHVLVQRFILHFEWGIPPKYKTHYILYNVFCQILFKM